MPRTSKPTPDSPPKRQLAPTIRSIAISPKLAKADDEIEISASGTPHGRARFSIPQISSATDIVMLEDPTKPGKYSGKYRTQRGDHVQDSAVTVILTLDNRTIVKESTQRLTISTIQPRIQDARTLDKRVGNGQDVRLQVCANHGCRVTARIDQLDTTGGTIALNEDPAKPGVYETVFKLSDRNQAPNGLKTVQIITTDAAGNESEPRNIEIELRNSELHKVHGLPDDIASKLHKEGITTLADLRQVNIARIAKKSGIASEELDRYRAAAQFQAVGVQADVAYALVQTGKILSIAQLALTPEKEVQDFLQTAIRDGIIPLKRAGVKSLASHLVALGIGTIAQIVNDQTNQVDGTGDSCLGHCSGEMSALGSAAYLCDLLRTANMSWQDFSKIFKQDYFDLSEIPVRHIDIAIKVLERIIQEDPQNPPRQPTHWHRYDDALNVSLNGLLVEAAGQSETALAKVYPRAFANQYSLHERNEEMQRLLCTDHPEIVDKLDQEMAEFAGLKLQALIQQSGKSETDLREEYYINFSPSDWSETTTFRQAILSLQEYLAEHPSRIKLVLPPEDELAAVSLSLASGESVDAEKLYLNYDEWRLEQVRKLYPQNIYSHEFKVPLVQGDRELLKRDLQQAQAILESVRVAERDRTPQKDDLLTAFNWRYPYYTNLKAGLDLIQECYDVDDLMVKGHQAFFHEEYHQARQYYLQAAEKIRQASWKISKQLGQSLAPLWAPNGQDSYLKRHPLEIRSAASGFLEALMLSQLPTNTPGIELERGQVSLEGVDEWGTFKPMQQAGIDNCNWSKHPGDWGISGELRTLLYPTAESGSSEDIRDGKLSILCYKGGKQWSDIKIQVETYTENITIGGVLVRFSPQAIGASVGIWGHGNEPFQFMDKYPGIIPNKQPDGPVRPFNYDLGEQQHRITATVIGNQVEAKFEKFNSGIWEPNGEMTPHEFTNLAENGSIALWGWRWYWNTGTGLVLRYYSSFTKIVVWDLSPATGAVGDLAFFLQPNPEFLNISGTNIPIFPIRYIPLVRYTYRAQGQSSPEETTRFLMQLPTMISMTYSENNRIIDQGGMVPIDPQPTAEKGPLDQLYEPAGTRSIGLWYGQGEDRLNRQNLRAVLNDLSWLFCHQYFFLLPVCLGDVANALGQYEEALRWYRLVYDERRSLQNRGMYPYLNLRIEGEMMRLRIAQNYVDWGDSLFNQNTEESIQEARRKYARTLRVLGTEQCCTQERETAEGQKSLSQEIEIAFVDASIANHIHRTISELARHPANVKAIQKLIGDVKKAAALPDTAKARFERISKLIDRQAPVINPRISFSTIQQGESTLEQRLSTLEERNPHILNTLEANLDASKRIQLQRPIQPVLDTAKFSIELRIPYKLYTDKLFRETYEKVNSLLGSPVQMIPVSPILSPYPALATPFSPLIVKMLPVWMWLGFCMPKNPLVEALSRRACQGIYCIDNCMNPLGFSQNDLSVYRFDYLVTIAKNFAQMALAAERDFMHFKQQFETETMELMTAEHVAVMAQAGVRYAELKVHEAYNQVEIANLSIERVNAQISQTQKRIDELGGFWSIFGIVLGTVAAAAATFFTAGAATGAAAAGIAAGIAAGSTSTGSYMAGMEESKEGLQMQLQLLKTVELNNAHQAHDNAIDAQMVAQQQARVAELEASFAAEKASLLATEFFNPQLWSFLARELKKHYQTYLTYGMIAAWLAQRALEFERGLEPKRKFAASGPDTSGSGLNAVRFDYFQPSLQGLLGAENLQRDIASLENEKYLTEQRKKSITKVISLSSTRPLLFAQFLETGVLPFATTLQEFDFDYPGHYQRRIRNVRINIFGLVGQEGIKATLTSSGISRVVVKEDGVPRFVEKTLRYLPESVALTNPQGGGFGQIALVPKEEMLNPFEGSGVAVYWVFEMPKYANQMDYNTITDIQILIDYTALDDSDYKREVLKNLPRSRSAFRTFSFRLEFPDALFHLKDSPLSLNMVQTRDITTGLYTLALDTLSEDFPLNQHNQKLVNAVVYIRSKGHDFRPLKVRMASKSWLISQNAGWVEANLEPNSFVEMETPPNGSREWQDLKQHYLGRQQAGQPGITGNIIDRWYFYISPDDNDAFLKKQAGVTVLISGHKVFDFSDIEDVIFGLDYSYEVTFA